MSQQAAAGQGAGRDGRRKPKYYPQGGGIEALVKAYKSSIAKIANNTFNTGQNKFAVQFTQSCKNVANYLQCTSMAEGYLVAETVHTGKKQIIELPPAMDPNAPDVDDLNIIRSEEVKSVAKRQQKLEEALKKGFATVYGQCFQEVRDKLENTIDLDKTQKGQSLDDLIQKIKRICVGFDNHKQEVFNLVQSLKTLFLYTQSEKETVEEYGRNFQSLWETAKANRGSPGIHKGMMDNLMKGIMGNPTPAEIKKVEETANEAVKGALLISGADKRHFGKLKDKLANNYLLRMEQYPHTSNKALQILGNYQNTRGNVQYRANPNDTGVAFLQRGSGGGQGTG
jgi:hypothetical protein